MDYRLNNTIFTKIPLRQFYLWAHKISLNFSVCIRPSEYTYPETSSPAKAKVWDFVKHMRVEIGSKLKD